MDKRYELYCLAHPHFYETPDRILTEDLNFDIARRRPPEGWALTPGGEWVVASPPGRRIPGRRIPGQGWKIHISGCLDNAERLLDRVWEYCIPREISFKFLRSRHILYLRNAKYAPRGHSGKLITIYPVDDNALEVIVKDLGRIFEGEPGPYILSDLRIGDGPLYVRYGGFAERYCESPNGDLVPALEDPDGRLVPDRRGSVFSVPEWAELPEFLRPHLDARNSLTVTGIPYDIERALHFSNGGGVYLGRRRDTGTQVVLKEARPHAGLAIDKADAVTRLEREAAVLERLDGLEVAPRLLDRFTLGEHHFLVMEYIEGEPLNRTYATGHPLLDPEPDQDKIIAYTERALAIDRAVERAVDRVHERGVVLNDVHMFNIMIRSVDGFEREGNDTIVLIDFEAASFEGDEGRQILAAPGFQAPPGRTGFDVDAYALACLRLALFMPITVLLALDRAKAAELAEVIAEHFPVPEAFLDEAVEEITKDDRTPRTQRPALHDWPAARDSMAQAILASATPERDDRLFPGDIRQFDGGGNGLAYGAAGILYALSVTGEGHHPEHEEWLIKHAVQPGSRLGLYDGLHGVAYALDHLGHPGEALRVVEAALSEKWERLGTDLSGGLAGIGLNLAHLADRTGERELHGHAMRAAEIIADRLGEANEVAETSGGDHPWAGLLRGSCGPALFFLRLYERDEDVAFLDLADRAIRQDLRRCVTDRNGALQVNEGWRTMPYLARGSAGIGCVLDDFLRHRRDADLAEASEAIRRAALSPFYIQAGLFDGRAGILLYLSRLGDPAARTHIRNLAWHAIDYHGHLAFPGEQLQRLSMDLATGTAGVLLALGAVLHDQPVHLPFMPPWQRGSAKNRKEVNTRGAS